MFASIKALLSGKTLFACSHSARRSASFRMDGEKVTFNLSDKQTEWCPECLSKMTILCVFCARPIFIGDPICLPICKKNKVPPSAVLYEDFGSSGQEGQYVSCLRFNCCDSGANRAGFWQPPGVVARVMRPVPQILDT
ncbi:MAG TPA: hypothetical protein VI981_02575 [Candidatus Paceibacterota bacterium]